MGLLQALLKKREEAMAKHKRRKNKGYSSAGGTTDMFATVTSSFKKCNHPAVVPTIIGGYEVYLGANSNIDAKTVQSMDYICALSGYMPSHSYFGQVLNMIVFDLEDRGGVPECWPKMMAEVIALIKDGKKVLAYCVGGHGRTGTFGASLIALMEDEKETPDPIDAIRVRHCHEAVESRKQALGIFALRGRELPWRYEAEFKESFISSSLPAMGWSGHL